jgi:hypothetical protein
MMSTRSPILTSFVLAAVFLLGAPAFAQNQGNPQSNPLAGQQSGSSAGSAQVRNQLRQTLEKAGYKNITIRPEAYVIHAQAPDGSYTVMMVTPNEVEGVTLEKSGSSNPQSSRGSGSGDSGSSTGNSGGSPEQGTENR